MIFCIKGIQNCCSVIQFWAMETNQSCSVFIFPESLTKQIQILISGKITTILFTNKVHDKRKSTLRLENGLSSKIKTLVHTALVTDAFRLEPTGFWTRQPKKDNCLKPCRARNTEAATAKWIFLIETFYPSFNWKTSNVFPRQNEKIVHT